ncbi:unnamed protein product, partial [Owenia fusiformis]
GNRAPPGAPWPLPREWENSTQTLTLDKTSFNFKSNINCDIIDEAFKRYKDYVFIDPSGRPGNGDKLEGIDLNIKSPCKVNGYPSAEENESYTISISVGKRGSIEAETVWGALRGLETFSQLIWLTNEKFLQVNVTTIRDWPRFSYRGIMIDTARHYQPLPIIYKNLDAMEQNKFNVLHWHIVDDQSFPYVSRTFANLSSLGAYSQKHLYTQKDVADIIQYARMRGIRVIPEFDTPGHTIGFSKAFPDLLTPCWGDGKTPYTPNYPEHAPAEILNPIQNYTYDFLRTFFSEIVDVFPDPFKHMGMDEVYYACWKSNPNITEFMSQNGMTGYNQLEQYYAQKLLNIMEELGSKYMIWQEPIDNNVTLQKDAIVNVWKDTYLNPNKPFDKWQNYISRIAKKGYKIVLAAPWYLNYIAYGYREMWMKYYETEPLDFEGTDEEKKLVIGGQACLWAEYVDGTNLLSRMWPRASAVGERLWSAREVNDSNSAAFRLDQHRCRMVNRGIPAQPILNGYCGDYEYGMDKETPVSASYKNIINTHVFVVVLLNVLTTSII